MGGHERPATMTLRESVRHIYRQYPLQENARRLLPWAAAAVGLRAFDIVTTYIGIRAGTQEEVWPITVALIQRIGTVPALACGLLTAIVTVGVMLLGSPLLRWAHIARPTAILVCLLALAPILYNFSFLLSLR